VSRGVEGAAWTFPRYDELVTFPFGHAMPSRRSTATLTLVLIGATALHGCGNDEEETATRDVYKSRADCQRDWARTRPSASSRSRARIPECS